MKIRSVIALISFDSDVQKAPVIYKTALCCIFLSLDEFIRVKAPLKNQS